MNCWGGGEDTDKSFEYTQKMREKKTVNSKSWPTSWQQNEISATKLSFGKWKMAKKPAYRKSIKLLLMENFRAVIFFFSLSFSLPSDFGPYKTIKSVSHITLFHSMVLTLDLFWKLINLLHLTRQPTVIELTSTMISGARIYTDTWPIAQHTIFRLFTHSLFMYALWFDSVQSRIDIKWTCWTENKLPIENTECWQIGMERLLFGRLEYPVPTRFNYMCWVLYWEWMYNTL